VRRAAVALAALLLALPAAAQWQEVSSGWQEVQNGSSSLFGLTPGGVVLATGAGTVGTDAGLAYNTTGAVLSAGKVLVADGTAAAPSLAFASKPNTGIYQSASGTVSFRANGFTALDLYTTYSWFSNSLVIGDNAKMLYFGSGQDLALSRAAAATLQLGAANAAAPVAQTLTFQSTTSNDTAGALFTLKGSQGKGTGSGGAIAIQTGITGGSAATANNIQTRYYINAAPKTLTLGSATAFARVDFPASSTVGIAVGYSIQVTDTAVPPEFKANSGRYYITCYRKSTGNAVCGTVVESGDNGVFSVGNAVTDTMTGTGDADGVILSQNAAGGTGLTGTPVGTMTWDLHIHGSSTSTVTPQ
jgi:hypothetical protein